MRLRSACAALPLVLVLLAPPRESGAQETAAADTIRLNFAWQPGTSARVTGRMLRIRGSADRADTTSSEARYLIAVEPHPDGLLIRHTDFDLGGTAEAVGDPAAEIIGRLMAASPSYIVSPGGEFLGLADPAALRTAMDELLASALGDLDSLAPEARAFFASVLSDESLAAMASQEWIMLVDNWLEGEFEAGATYELETMEPLPQLDGAEVPMRYEFGATGRVPCHAGDAGTGCVELWMTSAPAPEAVNAILERLFAAMGPEMAALSGTAEFDIQHRMVLVTEPATLLPHRLVTVKDVQVTLDEGQGPEQTHQLDRREMVIEHAHGAP